MRSILSVRVSVSVFMESVVTLSHSYLTPRAMCCLISQIYMLTFTLEPVFLPLVLQAGP